MEAVATLEPVTKTQFQPFIDVARQACARWDVQIVIPEAATVHETALLVRDALQAASLKAADSELPATYAGDVPGLVGSLPGLTLESLAKDMREGRNQGDEWGICVRVVAGDISFDVPIAFELDEDLAGSILSTISGRESDFVAVDDIAEMAGSDAVTLQAHADSWAHLKRIALDHPLSLLDTLPYRVPGAWDLFRAEMSGIVPKVLPLWSADDFETRYLLSVRYDLDGMAEAREMLRLYAVWAPEPLSTEWTAWFPQVTDLLHAIGVPKAMEGLSVVLHFSVEEMSDFDWEPVTARHVIVACGLDPIQAYALLAYVQREPVGFYDLPETEQKRFRLVGTTCMPDALLATRRVTASGRSDDYDRLAISLAQSAELAEMDEIED